MSNKTKTYGHMEIHIENETDILPDTIKRTFNLRNNRLSGNYYTPCQIFKLNYVYDWGEIIN